MVTTNRRPDGKDLKAIRSRVPGLTQKKLAEIIDSSAQHLSRVERGDLATTPEMVARYEAAVSAILSEKRWAQQI